MSDSIDELDHALRVLRHSAIAYRSPTEPASNGVGITASIVWNTLAYIVSCERFAYSGAYGETLSHQEHSFETLREAMDEIIKCGFQIENLETRPIPRNT
jgi:hypothetical protein